MVLNVSAQIKQPSSINEPLAGLLKSILVKDQKYREQLESTEQKYGFNSKEVKSIWDSIHKYDTENLILVADIIDKYGWPDSALVGPNGSVAIFLVIQHSDLKTQEKYLPVMREAVKKGNAYPHDLALLEDRVAIGKGNKQIYGSQVMQRGDGQWFILPIQDEANVNKRRNSVGLEPIEEYLRQWGIEYEFKKEVETKWDYRDYTILTIFLLISLFIALNTVYDNKP